LKIIQLINSLDNGGAEKFCVELSNEMSKLHDVTIVIIKPVESSMVPVQILSERVSLITMNNYGKYGPEKVFHLFKLIKKERPDIVHVHSSLIMIHLFLITRIFVKIKFVLTIHSTLSPAYDKLFKLISFSKSLRTRIVNVCLSKSLQAEFAENFSKLNFYCIENGISSLSNTIELQNVQNEIHSLMNNKNTKVFISIGNFTPAKNYLNLVSAFRELSAENIVLIIIGDDPSKGKIQWLEVEKIKPKNIYFLGSKSNVADYLSVSDALIIPSIVEGMPLVVLESFSMGIPVIATVAGGLKDMIDNQENGVIIEGFDSISIQTAIKKFTAMSQEHILEIKERNKKVFAERYQIKQCAAKYLILYKE
jgi:glycosyltransferase involved in cell wall biosynthesis